MARNLGTLTLDLLANISPFETNMKRAATTARTSTGQIEATVQRSTRAVSSAFGRLAGAAGLALSGAAIIQYAESWTQLENRLRLVTSTQQQLNAATNDVFQIARGTSQGLENVSTVYQRFAQNADALGISMAQVGRLTTTVSQAIAISGGSAQGASAALTQFGQALASGVLRGEEFNSIIEQAPALAQALADGLGVPVGQLRAMAQNGELVTSKLIPALEKASAAVNERFSTRVKTLGSSFTDLGTSMTRVVGLANNAFGGTGTGGNWIDQLASSLDRISFEDLARDADAFKVALDGIGGVVSGVLDDFTSFSGSSNTIFSDLGDSIKTNVVRSFTQMVYATAKELDTLASIFSGDIAGIQAMFYALGNNVEVVFANAFNGVLMSSEALVNGLAERLNKVAGLLNLPEIGMVSFGAREMQPLVSLTDAYAAAYRGASNLTIAQDAVAAAIGDGAMNRAADEAIAGYERVDAVVKKVAATTADAGKAQKDQGAQFLQQMRERIALLDAETEVQQLLAKISTGSITFRTEKQKEEALSMAEILDLRERDNEQLKENQAQLAEVESLLDRIFPEEARQNNMVEAQQQLNWALGEGIITLEQYERASKALPTTFGESLSTMDELARSAAQNIQSTLGDTLTDVLSGNFDDIAGNFAKTLASMAAQLASSAILKFIGGSLQGSDNSFLSGLGGALLGKRANGGPTAAGGMYEVNERGSPEMLTVGSKDYLMMGDSSGRVDPLTPASNSPSVGGPSVIIENHGTSIEARQEANNRMRIIANQASMETLMAEGPGLVANEVSTPNRKAWKAMNQSFNVTPKRA